MTIEQRWDVVSVWRLRFTWYLLIVPVLFGWISRGVEEHLVYKG
jgi:hypothetical protein